MIGKFGFWSTFDHGSHHNIKNLPLNMDFCHKINPIIIWSQSSDWLTIITFITKRSSPPPPCFFLIFFPPRYGSNFTLMYSQNISEQWYHNTSWSSRWWRAITNRRGRVHLHVSRRPHELEAGNIFAIFLKQIPNFWNLIWTLALRKDPTYQNGWVFRKVSNGPWPLPFFGEKNLRIFWQNVDGDILTFITSII